MRPDDRFELDPMASPGAFDALDADLMGLDAELAEAGRAARRRTVDRARPDRAFASTLRARLLAEAAAPVAAAGLRAQTQLPRMNDEGRAWAPTRLAPRVSGRPSSAPARPRWAFLAAAAMLVTAVAVGAMGVRFDWLLPAPSADPTEAALVSPPAETPAATARPLGSAGPPLATAAPTPEATATPTPKPSPASTPKATPKPKPTPTPKPDATAPAVGSLSLSVTGCPGANLLEWSSVSGAVKYLIYRSTAGPVPEADPGASATLLGKTGGSDGFDSKLPNGTTGWYRVFAYNGSGQLIALSNSTSMSAAAAIDLAGFSATGGPGSIDASWTPAPVPSACFSYGKLVASASDSNPSYTKGDPALAVISDQSIGDVHVDGLDPATLWVRYELLRSTSMGSFVVGRTTVLSVTVG